MVSATATHLVMPLIRSIFDGMVESRSMPKHYKAVSSLNAGLSYKRLYYPHVYEHYFSNDSRVRPNFSRGKLRLLGDSSRCLVSRADV